MRTSLFAVLSIAVVMFGTGIQTAQGQAPGWIYVPDTSIRNPKDAGIRAHTNHLILIGRPQGGSGVGGAMAPSDIRRAYNMPSTGGSNAIAIVDAYDDPSALTDFNTFCTRYSLPRETSTNVTASTNKVLQVVYQGGSKPRQNRGWAEEEALDIEWAHAMAPGAKIYLVEAKSANFTDLLAAEDLAARLSGVREISNSWGSSEFSSEASYDSHFTHSSIVYFASSGDSGGVVEYPACSPYVVGAGGTTLNLNGSGNLQSETGWSGSGGGNSAYEPKPAFQGGVAGTGSRRSVPDITSDSDPNTGVSVFFHGSWYIFGGTSVASPTLAGMANLAAHFRASSQAENGALYQAIGSSELRDILSGSAGNFSCHSGWDFVTGVGVPFGTGAI